MRKVIALLVLYVCGFAHAASEPPSPTPAEAAGKPIERAKRGKNGASPYANQPQTSTVVVVITPSSVLKVETTDKTEKHEDYFSHEWWLVYLTAVLASLTFGLAVYTAKLYRATVNIADDSKNAIISANRPRIKLRRVSVQDYGEWPSTGEPAPGSVRYTIVNTGNSAAKIFCRNITLVFTYSNASDGQIKLPPFPPYDVRRNNVIPLDVPPGDIDLVEKFLPDGVDDASKALLNFPSNSAYLVGFISYTDASLTRRFRTAFAWKLDRGTDGNTELFTPTDDPNYNYQD